MLFINLLGWRLPLVVATEKLIRYIGLSVFILPLFAQAGTRTIIDEASSTPLNAMRQWELQLQVAEQLISEKRVVECSTDNLRCAGILLSQSEVIVDLLSTLTAEWKVYQQNNSKALEYFVSQFKPAPYDVKQQYKRYLLVLNAVSPTSTEAKMLTGFLKGRLGHLDNHQQRQDLNTELIEIAQMNKSRLNDIRIQLMGFIRQETRLLNRLDI